VRGSGQAALFGGPLPAGFRYQPDVITREHERELLAFIRGLPFRAFEFHGHEALRRVVAFGWRYDFGGGRLQKAEALPRPILALRDIAAGFSSLRAESLEQATVTEYSPGAPIGWHRDRPVFDEVVGISLLAACTFRFRRQLRSRWERMKVTLEPRSAYLLTGPARTEWEHSIPPVSELRYSITFRSLLSKGA